MQIERPTVHDGSITDAFDRATRQEEPICLPVPIYADDRGWSIMNQLQGVLSAQGQINYSVMYPGIVKAWHRHRKQTDFWLGLHGMLRVGVHRESDKRTWQVFIGEKQPMMVIIPPPLWHGAATVGPEPAGLLYYVTQQYDPAEPDEQRAAYDAIEGFPWEVSFR